MCSQTYSTANANSSVENVEQLIISLDFESKERFSFSFDLIFSLALLTEHFQRNILEISRFVLRFKPYKTDQWITEL